MNEIDMDQVKRVAEGELEEEEFRREVEKMKIKLKERMTLWDKLFPWKILVIKKKEVI